MIGLLQRVAEARVEVELRSIADIKTGLLVFIGIEKDDNHSNADRLLHKLLGYRIFPDTDGKMNLSLKDIHGGLLLVPQFTLPADTRKGMRPSFSTAAPTDTGRELFNYLLSQARQNYASVEAGMFGADMKVHLVNEGPVTFWIQV